MNLLDNNTSNSISHLDSSASFKVSNLINNYLDHYLFDHWIILCIGTDRSTGDALGPFVGSKLVLAQPEGFKIFGTLDEPVHALNLKDTINLINNNYPYSGVIAIDSSLGRYDSVGSIQIKDGPLKPGAGVNKNLPEIGNFHITGVVNVGGFMECLVLQNTRLNLVVKMSNIISSSIIKSSYRKISNLNLKI
ncbi:MAG: spore protease YyaC [Vulcanibacillus sp.]